MPITSYLSDHGVDKSIVEGNCQQITTQVNDLIMLTSKPNLSVMEIGFNAGHSAEIFLENNKDLNLISFDLGLHHYVSIAKQYIDLTYPNRHTLILGGSGITIPKFINENKETKFDVIFIDGGHDYETAKNDLDNCFHLAHKDTIVILDDTICTKGWHKPWTVGPSRTWEEHVLENKITELKRTDYYPGHGMSWGRYVF
jgi:predicted O-methyltransferase YrrM